MREALLAVTLAAGLAAPAAGQPTADDAGEHRRSIAPGQLMAQPDTRPWQPVTPKIDPFGHKGPRPARFEHRFDRLLLGGDLPAALVAASNGIRRQFCGRQDVPDIRSCATANRL